MYMNRDRGESFDKASKIKTEVYSITVEDIDMRMRTGVFDPVAFSPSL